MQEVCQCGRVGVWGDQRIWEFSKALVLKKKIKIFKETDKKGEESIYYVLQTLMKMEESS